MNMVNIIGQIITEPSHIGDHQTFVVQTNRIVINSMTGVSEHHKDKHTVRAYGRWQQVPLSKGRDVAIEGSLRSGKVIVNDLFVL
jgi:hypothetical protein